MVGMIQERMKRLQESTINDNIVLGALATIGLSNHGILGLKACLLTMELFPHSLSPSILLNQEEL